MSSNLPASVQTQILLICCPYGSEGRFMMHFQIQSYGIYSVSAHAVFAPATYQIRRGPFLWNLNFDSLSLFLVWFWDKDKSHIKQNICRKKKEKKIQNPPPLPPRKKKNKQKPKQLPYPTPHNVNHQKFHSETFGNSRYLECSHYICISPRHFI